MTVSGDGTYNSPNPQFVPTLPGEYHWVAAYSGNLPNTNATTHNTDCSDSNEDVVVTTVASSLRSEQTWVPNDSVIVSAPAGSETWPAPCPSPCTPARTAPGPRS
ncbi:MAG TPA: hypothetical protein VIU11_26840 [Nakamurella sp.]